MDNDMLSLADARGRRTQDEVSKTLGVHANTLRNWENGKTYIPAIQFRALCELYEVDESKIILPSN